MQVGLQSPVRKICFVSVCLVLSIAYLTFCARHFIAVQLSGKAELPALEKAIRLEPQNADYLYLAGRYHLLLRQDPFSALPFFQSAVALNPHNAAYFFDLSIAQRLLGNSEEQNRAIERAIEADPTTPEIAWKAANLYWVEGRSEKALQEFRVVMSSDPTHTGEALRSCWKIQPNIETLLEKVIPAKADVYSTFLEFLISEKQDVAAGRLWQQIVKLEQPIETRYVFDYVHYLIDRKQVEQADQVWSDAGSLSGLDEYQPSTSNSVVNGDFSLPILNAGFDWRYEEHAGVSLGLDPTESHSGHRSLSVVFDSSGIADAGIQEFVSVTPNAGYEFSAYFKSEDIQGAGGPRLLVQDHYDGRVLFSSDDLRGADFWKQIIGTFNAGPNTKLITIRLARIPAGDAIRGRLWLDNLRMSRKDKMEGAE